MRFAGFIPLTELSGRLATRYGGRPLGYHRLYRLALDGGFRFERHGARLLVAEADLPAIAAAAGVAVREPPEIA